MKRHKNVEIIVEIIVTKIFNLNEKKVTFTFLHLVHSAVWIFCVVDIIIFSLPYNIYAIENNVTIIVKIIVTKIFNLNEEKVTFRHSVHSSVWIFVVVVDIIIFSLP